MASHVFHEIYLHLNWHTKDNAPLITPHLEKSIHEFLQDRCRQKKGSIFSRDWRNILTMFSTARINIEPFVTISDLKGACSHEINQQQRMKALEWQRGFGVVSFGRKQLPWVREYILNQKQHHATGQVFDRLERTEFDEESDVD